MCGMEPRNYIKEIRAARGISQAAMARELGCSIQAIKLYEANGTMPKNAAVMRNLQALATLVNTDIEELSEG